MKKLFVALFGVMAIAAADDKPVGGPKLGDPAPLFAVRDLKGRMTFLKDLVGPRAPPRSKKNAVILDFFQTTCKPCIEELPLLTKAHKDWAAKGVEFVMVSYGEPTDKIQKFVDEKALTNIVLTDPYGTAANMYKVTALPRTYVLDGAGKVRYLHSGKSATIDLDIAKVLKELAPATTEVSNPVPKDVIPAAQK